MIMKAKKFFSALTSCTAILLCSVFACACVGVTTSTESTKQIVETQEEIKETIEQQETQKEAKEESQPVIINYNIDNSDNSVDNSYVDNSYNDYSTYSVTEDNDSHYENHVNNTIVEAEPKLEKVEKPTDYINSETNEEDITIPIGDESNDSNPNPNVVLIKGIKCPECGEHSYTEMYNKRDTNLQHYIGMCKLCNYEY